MLLVDNMVANHGYYDNTNADVIFVFYFNAFFLFGFSG